MEKILRLQRLGRNYWGNIAYEDKESGKIYFYIEDGHSDNYGWRLALSSSISNLGK